MSLVACADLYKLLEFPCPYRHPPYFVNFSEHVSILIGLAQYKSWIVQIHFWHVLVLVIIYLYSCLCLQVSNSTKIFFHVFFLTRVVMYKIDDKHVRVWQVLYCTKLILQVSHLTQVLPYNFWLYTCAIPHVSYCTSSDFTAVRVDTCHTSFDCTRANFWHVRYCNNFWLYTWPTLTRGIL